MGRHRFTNLDEGISFIKYHLNYPKRNSWPFWGYKLNQESFKY